MKNKYSFYNFHVVDIKNYYSSLASHGEKLEYLYWLKTEYLNRKNTPLTPYEIIYGAKHTVSFLELENWIDMQIELCDKLLRNKDEVADNQNKTNNDSSKQPKSNTINCINWHKSLKSLEKLFNVLYEEKYLKNKQDFIILKNHFSIKDDISSCKNNLQLNKINWVGSLTELARLIYYLFNKNYISFIDGHIHKSVADHFLINGAGIKINSFKNTYCRIDPSSNDEKITYKYNKLKTIVANLQI